jgi:hypothetical protein
LSFLAGDDRLRHRHLHPHIWQGAAVGRVPDRVCNCVPSAAAGQVGACLGQLLAYTST